MSLGYRPIHQAVSDRVLFAYVPWKQYERTRQGPCRNQKANIRPLFEALSLPLFRQLPSIVQLGSPIRGHFSRLRAAQHDCLHFQQDRQLRLGLKLPGHQDVSISQPSLRLNSNASPNWQTNTTLKIANENLRKFTVQRGDGARWRRRVFHISPFIGGPQGFESNMQVPTYTRHKPYFTEYQSLLSTAVTLSLMQ